MGFRGFTGSNPVRPTMNELHHYEYDGMSFADYSFPSSVYPRYKGQLLGGLYQDEPRSGHLDTRVFWIGEMYGEIGLKVFRTDAAVTLQMKNWIYT